MFINGWNKKNQSIKIGNFEKGQVGSILIWKTQVKYKKRIYIHFEIKLIKR